MENEEKEIIKFHDWQKFDIRVGKILKAEPIEGTDTLYKIEVDLGKEKRTIVSGLRKYYTKEQLEGKRVIIFCNLEPRTIRGIESKGMVLAAVTYDKKGKEKECKLLKPDDKIELGARVC
ncbi:unnamed protein product [marine sediment metagenome]|uniref:Methionine--tRNA ligase n=1 Tax=marine sediment metagenome TaxID=412755 RepID=X1S3I0_9ZZZZ